MSHYRPRVGDHVYSTYRDQYGRNPQGIVKRIKWEDEEVVVRFLGGKMYQFGYGNFVLTEAERQWFCGGGEVDTFSFDEFLGCWSSHEGGDGEWKISG